MSVASNGPERGPLRYRIESTRQHCDPSGRYRLVVTGYAWLEGHRGEGSGVEPSIVADGTTVDAEFRYARSDVQEVLAPTSRPASQSGFQLQVSAEGPIAAASLRLRAADGTSVDEPLELTVPTARPKKASAVRRFRRARSGGRRTRRFLDRPRIHVEGARLADGPGGYGEIRIQGWGFLEGFLGHGSGLAVDVDGIEPEAILVERQRRLDVLRDHAMRPEAEWSGFVLKLLVAIPPRAVRLRFTSMDGSGSTYRRVVVEGRGGTVEAAIRFARDSKKMVRLPVEERGLVGEDGGRLHWHLHRYETRDDGVRAVGAARLRGGIDDTRPLVVETLGVDGVVVARVKGTPAPVEDASDPDASMVPFELVHPTVLHGERLAIRFSTEDGRRTETHRIGPRFGERLLGALVGAPPPLPRASARVSVELAECRPRGVFDYETRITGRVAFDPVWREGRELALALLGVSRASTQLQWRSLPEQNGTRLVTLAFELRASTRLPPGEVELGLSFEGDAPVIVQTIRPNFTPADQRLRRALTGARNVAAALGWPLQDGVGRGIHHHVESVVVRRQHDGETVTRIVGWAFLSGYEGSGSGLRISVAGFPGSKTVVDRLDRRDVFLHHGRERPALRSGFVLTHTTRAPMRRLRLRLVARNGTASAYVWVPLPAAAPQEELGPATDRIEAPYESWLRVNREPRNRFASIGEDAGLVPRASSARIDVLSRFEERLESVECVTFDLFDTLVERVTSEPVDVFRVVGLHALEWFRTPEAFAVARIDAETEARRSSERDEVTLDEIYAQLRVGRPIDDATVEVLKGRELEVERSVIVAKEEGRRLFDAAKSHGLRVEILSDIYLPKGFVEEILVRTGFDAVDGLLVSSDLGKTKHHGTLFDHWLGASGIAPDRVLHVGDNEHSDGSVPHSKGIQTFSVQRTLDVFLSDRKRAKSFDAARSGGMGDRLALGLVAHGFGRASLETECRSQYLANPYVLGYATLGPLLLGFSLDLARAARTRGTSSYAFLSRDGYVLKVAYDRVARAVEGLPPSTYVAASRTLCSAASIDSIRRVQEVAAVDHYPMPIGDLLRHRFGCTDAELAAIPAEVLEVAKLAGLDEVVGPDHPGKRPFFEALGETLVRTSAERARRYSDYLLSLGIDFDRASVVDIGYAGTNQRAIAQLLGAEVDGAYLITSVRAERLKSAGLHARGWLGDCVALDDPFFAHVQNWELFFSATHGSTLDVRLEDGRWKPVFDDNLLDPASRALMAVVHRGALDFVDRFVEHHGGVLEQLVLEPQVWRTPLSGFFADPDADDCAPFTRVIFEDRFGGDVRALAVFASRGSAKLPGIEQGVVWTGAVEALSRSPSVVSPYFPACPARAAVTRGLLGDDGALIDLVEGSDLVPSWTSPEYDAVFGPRGAPTALAPLFDLELFVPVSKVDRELDSVLASLRQQTFAGLRVVLVCLPGVDPDALRRAYRRDAFALRSAGSVAELVSIAAGSGAPWVVLHDGETRLAPTFSAEISAATRRSGSATVIIADEDRLATDGTRVDPHFKPEWSPALLLSTDYFGGVFAVRTSSLAGVAVSGQTTRGALWELALAVAQGDSPVHRIPRVLSHRPAATDVAPILDEARAFLAAEFRRQGVEVEIDVPGWASEAGRLACVPRFADVGPRVAIVIPTKNQHEVTRRCIESLALTTYRDYRVYLVDNHSDDPGAIEYYASLPAQGIRVLRIASPPSGFSFSYVNNRAVEQTDGEELLLFLNNDTEVVEPRWLSQMVGWQRLEGVGSVGALLYYPNDLVQHAGITHRLLYNVLPAPSFKLVPKGQRGYQDYLFLARESAAQTAACLLTPRSVFCSHGMFDETDFGVAYNDCDYGFKLAQAGLRNVYCPDAVLYHYEGLTRGRGRGNDKPSEEAAFVRKYAEWKDPFYSRNLADGRTDFAVRPTAVETGPVPRLRVAFVTHNLNYEGAPLVLREIALGLARRGEVAPVFFSMDEGPLRADLEANGVEVHVVSEPNALFLDGDTGRAEVSRMAAAFAARAVDVVLANTVLAWWAVEAASLVGIPSLWIIHESEPPFTHLGDHSAECRKRGQGALAIPYRVVYVSYATRDVYASLETRNNFHTFHNGFDAADYARMAATVSREEARARLGVAPDELLGLLPGTVCERKAQLDIVRAIARIDPSALDKTRIFLVGDRSSPYSDALHAAVAALPAERRAVLRVLPHSKGMVEYFVAADFMVSTAHVEAFPKVVQEGMFFGLPMVLAPVFGIVEQVQDEVSALFFPPGDDEQLALRLERIVRDAALRAKLAENARVSLSRLPTIDEMLDEYGRLVREAWLTRSGT